MLWQNTVVLVLDLRIENSLRDKKPNDLKPIRIADLGCGNGVWLTDLHQNLEDYGMDAELVGYDISDQNFPPPAFLPDRIELKKLDILSSTLPGEAVGTFDVVHIRAFASIIINNDTTSLLRAAMTMLKPGGHIQWDEMSPQYYIEPASPGLSTAACQTMVDLVKAGADARGVKEGFVRDLYFHLSCAGFEDAKKFRHRKRKQDYKGWTEDFLAVWEGIAEFLPPRTEGGTGPLTKESWAELFEKVVWETEQGVAIHRGSLITATGRKPF
ncbi:hypothetical protein NPX13_g1730 [Xylaria arbuscula]|uniref:Methyltransferase type 12 domain-containing protein n=1 Tax=Xylaria arbuscula TaxID=114810 RepID=A0A9W8NKW7_9PEZI|nr:hypothetical protein NPX13_g1730 [Xylaria arbuscula]